MIALYLLIALRAGTLITVQTGSNARLKEAFGHPLPCRRRQLGDRRRARA
jgi:uncharacterized membrane protein YdcZ (DUF606 family)